MTICATNNERHQTIFCSPELPGPGSASQHIASQRSAVALGEGRSGEDVLPGLHNDATVGKRLRSGWARALSHLHGSVYVVVMVVVLEVVEVHHSSDQTLKEVLDVGMYSE